MSFCIADTFTASLTRLSGDEQKSAKTTTFDIQLTPANPGLSFHKLDQAMDKYFWAGEGGFRPFRIKVNGVGVFHPNIGEVCSDAIQRPLQGPENHLQGRNRRRCWGGAQQRHLSSLRPVGIRPNRR